MISLGSFKLPSINDLGKIFGNREAPKPSPQQPPSNQPRPTLPKDKPAPRPVTNNQIAATLRQLPEETRGRINIAHRVTYLEDRPSQEEVSVKPLPSGHFELSRTKNRDDRGVFAEAQDNAPGTQTLTVVVDSQGNVLDGTQEVNTYRRGYNANNLHNETFHGERTIQEANRNAIAHAILQDYLRRSSGG